MARAGVKESQWSFPRHALTAQRPEQRSQRFCHLRRAASLPRYLPTYLHTSCASSSPPAAMDDSAPQWVRHRAVLES